MVNEYKWLKLPPKGYEVINPKLYSRIDEKIDKFEPFHLVFTGKPGTGKSMLAGIIVAGIIDKMKTEQVKRLGYAKTNSEYCSIYNARELYMTQRNIMMSNFNDKGSELRKMDRCLRAEVCLLDDIGTEPATADNERPNLYIAGLIEDYYAYANKVKCFSVFTTNLTDVEIGETYGARVQDRLYDKLFQVIVFKNESFRQKQSRPVITI